MTIAYDALTPAQKAAIQTQIKAQRDAAAALVSARKLILRAQAMSAANYSAIASLDGGILIPLDQSIQGNPSVFATQEPTAAFLAALEGNLEAVNSVIGQTSPMVLWGEAIGPENVV